MSRSVSRVDAFESARDTRAEPDWPRWQRGCDRLVDDKRFTTLVISVILLNALSLGLITFEPAARRSGDLLGHLDDVFLGFFVLELFLRVAAVGFRVDRFLRRGWNLFDVLAVGAAFVPGLGANATALRMVRLLRVARLLSVMPDVKLLLMGLRRAARPSLGIVLLVMLIMYVYAIIGWSLFAEADPERWGNVGLAMLTLFQLLTHHDWPPVLAPLRHASPFAVTFVVSYIAITALVVMQFLLATILTSLEGAAEVIHASDHDGAEDESAVLTGIAAMRASLDRLEARRALPHRARG